MSHVLPDNRFHGSGNFDHLPPTPTPDEAEKNVKPQDQLWRYRSQFKKLLGICLEILHTLSSNGTFPSENDLLKQCHRRLHLWSMGSYQQLVEDDTCEWNRGAQALMNLVAVFLIDIAILLGTVSNSRTSLNTCHQTRLALALSDVEPKLVMQYRAQMAWVHESDYGSPEIQDIEYLAQIVERLHALLPAMRDLRKIAVLKEERRPHHAQQRFEIDDHVNDPPLTVSKTDEREDGLTPAGIAVPSYFGMSDMLYSLLGYFANLWKQTQYHAEEIQSLHITVLMMPTARISTSTLTQYAQTKAKMRAGPSFGNQKDHKRSKGMNTASQRSSFSMNASSQVLSQYRPDQCEQKLREDRMHKQAALGAGAAGLAIARMLLTRRAQFRVRV